MKIKNKHRLTEIIIYILAALAVLSIPFYDYNQNDIHFLPKVFSDWLLYVPWMILYLFNAEFLVPRYFLKQQKLYYFIDVFFAIILVSLFSFSFNYKKPFLPEPIAREMIAPPGRGPVGPEVLPPPRKPVIWILNNMLISVLVVGFSSTIKIATEYNKNEKQKKELERESLKTELAFLKTQISPHFFLNTLNNIHALTEIDVGQAQKAIRQLSHLMRYLLYDSDKNLTPFKSEMEFIKNYVQLMKLRLTEEVDVKLILPKPDENILIPPLLFISFIENAFKHGVSYQNDSYIDINFQLHDGWLIFNSANSNHSRSNANNNQSGIGLKNTRKRLDLLFSDNYFLDIIDTGKQFHVQLKIPLYDN